MRTRTAMELFGKSGARMLALLGDSSALQLATEQVGSLGAIMDANAGKFDRMSDSINTLSGLKLEQLFAGIAAEAAGSADNMERITKLDFSSVGSGVFKAISSSLNPAYGFLKAVSTLRSKFLASRATPIANLVSANAETEDNFNQRMADRRKRLLQPLNLLDGRHAIKLSRVQPEALQRCVGGLTFLVRPREGLVQPGDVALQVIRPQTGVEERLPQNQHVARRHAGIGRKVGQLTAEIEGTLELHCGRRNACKSRAADPCETFERASQPLHAISHARQLPIHPAECRMELAGFELEFRRYGAHRY